MSDSHQPFEGEDNSKKRCTGNSKRRCKSCKDYFPAEEVVNSNLGNFCTTCFGDAEKRYPTKLAKPGKTRKRTRTRGGAPPEVKEKIRTRDKNRCRWCSSPRILEVHHIEYRSQGGSDEQHNLITLCKEHHEKAHSHKGAWQDTLKFSNWILLSEHRIVSMKSIVHSLIGDRDDVEDALSEFWELQPIDL